MAVGSVFLGGGGDSVFVPVPVQIQNFLVLHGILLSVIVQRPFILTDRKSGPALHEQKNFSHVKVYPAGRKISSPAGQAHSLTSMTVIWSMVKSVSERMVSVIRATAS